MNRRIFEGVLVIVVLWDLAKPAIRLWRHVAWQNSKPGSAVSDAADLSTVLIP